MRAGEEILWHWNAGPQSRSDLQVEKNRIAKKIDAGAP